MSTFATVLTAVLVAAVLFAGAGHMKSSDSVMTSRIADSLPGGPIVRTRPSDSLPGGPIIKIARTA